jgi:RNA processing factor Prp31
VRSNAGVEPVGNAADWAVVEFPEILARHVKYAAVADALQEDENFDKADKMEFKAEEALADEFDRVAVKQRQTRRFGVMAR